MISWKNILLGKPKHPYISNLREVKEDTLYFDSLTRGTLVTGNPGVGKTTWLAMLIISYALAFPKRPIFVLDASGSLTNEIIELCYLLPSGQFEAINRRIIYDEVGNEKWVIPKPLFSPTYGLSAEDLVQKAVNILKELNPEKIERNPTMSSAISQTAPQLFRLLQVIKNDAGETWQISEAKRLLYDTYRNGLLHTAVNRFGHLAPSAKDYFEKTLLRVKLPPTTRTAKTDALIDALQIIEPKPLRARYGYGRPGVTTKEIVEKGLIYLVNGAELNNQKDAQAWVFWDEYASLKAIINKRTPHNPDDVPVLLVIDEAYQLFKIKGMAEEIGLISAYYRSRKLQLIMVIQAFWQLNDLLKEQIWNLGNLVTFAMDNQIDAYKWAQQAFKYDPKRTKPSLVPDRGQPIVEPDRGQYLTAANWIQRLAWRQIVMRRYLNERDKEPFVAFIDRTREKPAGQLPAPLSEIKEELLKRRAIPVKDALAEINKRKLIRRKKERPTV